MKRFETIFKVASFFIATIFFIVNLHRGTEFWIWPLGNMFWVSVCFYKSRRIEHLEIEKKFKK
jgi:hypothetical protein